MTKHLALGMAGETLAATYLAGRGYRILERNARLGHLEIDIIAMDPNNEILVFVEVKTRRAADPDFPVSAAFTLTKHTRIRHAAHRWNAARNYTGGFRIDLICIAEMKVADHVIDIL